MTTSWSFDPGPSKDYTFGTTFLLFETGDRNLFTSRLVHNYILSISQKVSNQFSIVSPVDDTVKKQRRL